VGVGERRGHASALRALQEGEKHGARIYHEALSSTELTPDSRELIATRLLPGTRAHIPVLDQLITNN